MRRLMFSRLSWVVAGSLLLTACGQGGVAGAARCPTEDEIGEMSSEELNEIPRECDGAQEPLQEAPGVSVSNDSDDRDGRPTSAAKLTFGPPGEVLPAEIEDAGDADFWGLEWPGGAIRVVVTAPGSAGRVAVTDLEGDPQLGDIGPEAVSALEGALPAGRYLVRVFSAEGAATPFRYEVVSRPG